MHFIQPYMDMDMDIGRCCIAEFKDIIIIHI